MQEDDRNLIRAASFEHEHEAILFRNLLNDHGIPAWVTGGDGVNTFGAGLTAAGLVGVDVRIHQINLEAAQKILNNHQAKPPNAAWKCTCGAQVDAGFEVCWSCGTDLEELQSL